MGANQVDNVCVNILIEKRNPKKRCEVGEENLPPKPGGVRGKRHRDRKMNSSVQAAQT